VVYDRNNHKWIAQRIGRVIKFECLADAKREADLLLKKFHCLTYDLYKII
jgi:hypothetical protein